MLKYNFIISLLSLIFYGLLIGTIESGVSTTKIIITLLIWISFGFSFLFFVQKHRTIKEYLPSYAFNIYIALIIWNGINIVRGFFSDEGTITTLLGNPYTSLALLVPFALVFGVDKMNLRIINRFFIFLISIGIPVLAISVILDYSEERVNIITSLASFAGYAVFLVTTLSFQRLINRYWITVASVLIFIKTGLVVGSRATVMRIGLLYLSLVAIYGYRKLNLKWIPTVSILTLLIPFYALLMSSGGESFFQTSLATVRNLFSTSSQSIVEKADTRTFLYTEVFDDLLNNNEILVGKGSNGTYNSPYFRATRQDNDQRLTVEVGVLAIFLKGGLIAVILNLALFFIAIYLAFYKSNNDYVMGIGFMLLVHTLILFVENLVSYSMYNFAIWFFTGVCLSRPLRIMNNQEIRWLLNAKIKKLTNSHLKTP